MKSRDEIRRILVDDMGFKNLDAYKAWITNVRPTLTVTQERIDLLSPDAIDCRAFWRVCDELFGTDPVCNVALAPRVGALPYDIATPLDANRMNLRLAKSLGITAFLEETAQQRLNVLEIGAGYGSLKHFIETQTNHNYVGVDAVPRIAGVLEVTADGLLPRDLVAQNQGKFSYVIATNVFQHLSERQRQQFTLDAQELLHDGGLFIFNLTLDSGKAPAYMRDASGKAWTDHYGQFTLMPTADLVYGRLRAGFDILYVTQRYDSLFNFVCQKRAA